MTADRSARASGLLPLAPKGLVLAPFRALRYAVPLSGLGTTNNAEPGLAELTSPPYDVLTVDDVVALEKASDHNVVRLILPRPAADGLDRYEHAARLLTQWRAAGVLQPDEAPALYVYEQADQVTGLAQRGLLGALALTPAEDGIVLPHENTMAGPVADRLALYTAVQADLEPIFLVYDGGGPASRAVAAASDQPALVDVVLPDGLRHRLWSLTDPTLLAEIAADLAPRVAVIADGHHRYATYLQRQRDHHQAGAGAGPWDAGLTFLVDAHAFGPQVHPIHRVIPGLEVYELINRIGDGIRVHDLDGNDLDSALDALAEAGQSGPAFLLVSGDGGTIRLLESPHPGRLAAALPVERSAAWRALDVVVLHTYLVTELWELADTVETVGYEHDAAAAIATAARTGGTAVLLNPTPVAAVTAVAGGGERMPRKSTLFTPKPRSGLLIRDHRDY